MDKSYVGLLLLVLILQVEQTMLQPQQTIIDAIQQSLSDLGTPYSIKVYDVANEQDRIELVASGIGAHSTRNEMWKLGDLKLLPSQTGFYNQPPEWNVHVLRNGIWTIAVLTRNDNMFLCGYWTESTGWRELNSHFIPFSELLNFGVTYIDLNGERENLTSLPLGLTSLGEAVRTLSTTTEVWAVKRALTILVITLCETQRFTAIRDCLLRGWEGDTCRLTEKDIAFLVKWGELSCAMLEGWPDDPDDTMYNDLKELMTLHNVAEEDVPGMLVVILRGYECRNSIDMDLLTPIIPASVGN